MEELLLGSILVWALGRITKKKADAPAPGPIAPPRLPKTSPGSQNTRPVGPGSPTAGAPGGGRPGVL